MKKKQKETTYIIQHKETKEQWSASSGKNSWRKPAHAKNAWKGSSRTVPEHLKTKEYSWDEVCRFDDQDEYEIIELKSDDAVKLEKIKRIVELAGQWCDDNRESGLMNDGNICISAMRDIRNILSE